ncbi:divalent anion:Na+ symporter, DASS family [Marchantia polymorpha subsp. ruderalis]|uniref:Uncharacterized protein n=2 Tax=Marchantia polymorpha TaxID=3197 RepID=A0A176VT72_MARPO|nr:hypothetical protein AXG93_4284s1020 [Marchantia polymorpha subsp. ruderalis]PTQ38805.1 hypothetical protein MARPO_0049s0084 [Marchantia polymorpha]BBN06238.1 hypothetical protein Mp_3g19500 [Marchantia polymorpha subsp. ruderalis]|eukprot:PTQ38805.1 hypothetical protein MARPO_0049s0084 [Marchantia polymorpha]
MAMSFAVSASYTLLSQSPCVDGRRHSPRLRNFAGGTSSASSSSSSSSSYAQFKTQSIIRRRSIVSRSSSSLSSSPPPSNRMYAPLLPVASGLGSSHRILKPVAAKLGAEGAPIDDGIQEIVEAPPKAWEGAKPIPLILSVAVGLIIRFLVPKPVAVTAQAWQLFAIFLSTIAGLVLAPLPVGAWAFLGLTVTVLTKTLPFAVAFSAFTNEVLWLIVISFFFARGFVKTGLGDRVATYFVKWLGKSTLGLSYGLTAAEALIAPAMPSTTARAGGVFLPIIQSLSLASDSHPNDKSSKKLGAYLVQTQFQAAGNSSAMYLTGAAQNLLCLNLAKELGVNIANPWVAWFQAASVPAIVAMLTTPLIMYNLFPPEIKSTPDAPAMAEKKLQALGPVTQSEWVMVGTMLLAVTLWVFGDALGVASVVAAMLGLSILLTLGVLKWDDCLSEKSAWDTLAWFAVLVGMASQLTSLGLVQFMADSVGKFLGSFSLGWPATFGILQAVYFLSHYLFASQTGHVGALYSAILAMQLAAGVPAVLAALALAFNTNLFGALTHYSSGQAAVYFGAGYVELPDVFRLGAIMAVWNILVWSVVGGLWWKFLGLY